jgi:hypothetical protein
MDSTRASHIALLARTYTLLSERPEYLIADAGERIERVLDPPLPLNSVDKTLLMAVTEIDRVCGYTVSLLRQRMSKALLDGLGVMDPDRLVAIYYALPKNRRQHVRKDPVWAYHIDHAPEGLVEVLAGMQMWLAGADRAANDGARLDATVPYSVSNKLKDAERTIMREQAGIDVGRRLMQNVALIGEEIAALPESERESAQAWHDAAERATNQMSVP